MLFKKSAPWIVTTCILFSSVVIQYLQYSHDSEVTEALLETTAEDLNQKRKEAAELESRGNDLEARADTLNDTVIQLQTTKQHLQSEIHELEAVNAAQRKSTNYIQQVANNIVESEPKRVLSDLVQNSQYFVVISAIGSDRDRVRLISSVLSERGYSVNSPVFYQNKPTWYPISNTVFYFSEESKDKAEQLAERIKDLTEQNVIIDRGPASRVARTNAQWKLEVSLLDVK